ncbi:MAG: choice-of-anchor J domain-containing protein [Bacteroidales bacterium]|nr:choice-of-anchor J domain-containing protein [Bacteroidales bacterium]
MISNITFLTVILIFAGQGNLTGQNPSIALKRCFKPESTLTRIPPSVGGIGPLLQTRWGEGCRYNASCPTDTASQATCLHVPAGAGAVAMSQIMKYYQYPAHGTGEHGNLHPKYGIQYANFGTTIYHWGTMPDSLITDNEGLATLIYQCGVAHDINFGSLASISEFNKIDSAFVKYFSYPNTANWKSKADYSDTVWMAMLRDELDAEHPLLFYGTDSLGLIQNFFVCDGYQGDQFHFNWGMGGAHDGYYRLDNLRPGTVNFAYHQRALFNLAPSSPGPSSYIMDFENVPDFALTFNDWTVKDVDMHDTYGITGYSFPHQSEPMAFISFNPASVVPSMASDQAIQPHSGQRFGACFSSNPPSNNDWFISPQIQLGINGSFSFWIKSYNDLYGLDNYTVAVSTTDNMPESYTTISGIQPLQTTLAWTKMNFNLSNFNNQKIYIAIHCVSNDNFLMMIDDLEVKPQAPSTLAADFTADKTTVRVGEAINFSDQSSGLPTTWNWKFTGGTPSTSITQNPEGIKYSAPGSYPVSLKVSNGSSIDSVTKTAYITVTGYSTSMYLDFELFSDFTTALNPWTVVDVKGGSTYGIQSVSFPHNYQPMAFICFNPWKTTPPLNSEVQTNMPVHSGQKLGCSFSSVPPLNPNDKWLISPKMSLGLNPQVEFWVKTYNNQFGEERYNVSVSTTDLSPSSFSPLTPQPESAPVDWTRRTYSLSDYTNQDVYVAIQCVTNDGFIFMIDDISITSSLGLSDKTILDRLVIYPNPARDLLFLNSPATGPAPVAIEMINILGEWISSWHEVAEPEKIMLDISNIPQGIYLLRIKYGAEEVTRKISILNH